MLNDIVYKKLSYQLTGLCFKIQDELGRFCREKQYADQFEKFLQKEGIDYKREFEINKMNDTSPKGNRVDFLIEYKIIIDCKAKNFITKDDYFQMRRYLECADLKLGLIINFRDSHLKPKRVLNGSHHSH